MSTIKFSKCIFIAILICYINFCYSQAFNFEPYQPKPLVINVTDTLINPWAGGLNAPQFSTIDVNGDTLKDLFIFERDGYKSLVFKATLAGQQIIYRRLDTSSFKIPPMQDWTLLRDFNCDGKKDIFTYGTPGIKVFKNTSTLSGELQFQQYTQRLKSDFGSLTTAIYVSSADIPVIQDLDADGDLDVLVFGFLGTCVEFHKNLSQELYGHCDSLTFSLVTRHWGDFSEGASLQNITLNTDCGFNKPAKEQLHVGSTMLCVDFYNDGDPDLVLGDVGSNKLVLLRNGSGNPLAVMDTVLFNFPASLFATSPVDIPIFPACYFEDINADNAPDIIVAPNTTDIIDAQNGVWRYTNSGTAGNFNFSQPPQKGFLQNEMIELGENAFPACVDLNNDGLLDLAIGIGKDNTAQATIVMYFGDTAKNFILQTSNLSNITLQNWLQIAPTFGDLDNDGDLDMLVGEQSGKLHYFENTAPVLSGQTPSFVLTQTNYFSIQEIASATPFLFDLNKDGLLDIITGSRSGKLNYYENTGSAALPQFSSTPTITNLGNVNVVDPNTGSLGYSVPVLMKINGETELFVGAQNGKIWHYSNLYQNLQIATNFTLITANLGFTDFGFRSAPSVDMFNADTFPDFFVGNQCGGVELYQGIQAFVGIPMETTTSVLQIYPNPAFEKIIVKNTTSAGLFRIYTISGKIVYTGQLKSGINIIDIYKLAKGIYLLNFVNQTHAVSKKLIVH